MLSLLSRRKKLAGIAYLLSFPANDQGLIARLQQKFGTKELVIFYTRACQEEALTYQAQGLRIVALDNPWQLFTRAVPYLTRAQVILCDNYFALLGDLVLRDGTQVIQLWHANGAIKTFGWEDQQTALRSPSDQARFQRVYDQFDQIVVGSTEMGRVFQNSYRLDERVILPIGLPRTDSFFSRQQGVAAFAAAFPEASEQTVVLYVPTYRPHEETVFLDVAAVQTALGSEYLVLAKYHPHTVLTTKSVGTDLRGLSLVELLPAVDVLVTDYSSVPFEYSLANPVGKVLFFVYDFADYQATTGLQAGFPTWAEESLVFQVEELVARLKKQQGLASAEINARWNTFNDGQATERLVALIAAHLRR